MSWSVVLSKQAMKDLKKIKRARLSQQVKKLLETLKEDPFVTSSRYEKLVGNLQGFYSRRINIKHRLVYSINSDSKTVHILHMWTHYE